MFRITAEIIALLLFIAFIVFICVILFKGAYKALFVDSKDKQDLENENQTLKTQNEMYENEIDELKSRIRELELDRKTLLNTNNRLMSEKEESEVLKSTPRKRIIRK